MNRLFASTLALLLLFCAAPAAAVDYVFTLEDYVTDQDLAVFTLNSSPDPTDSEAGYYFYVSNVTNQLNNSQIQYVTFYNVAHPNNYALSFESGGKFTLITQSHDDRPLYTGPEADPTFIPSGSRPYIMYDQNNKFYQLTVQAVPEPATWLMMIVGFGAVGVSLRRKHRVSDGNPTYGVRQQALA